MRLFKKTILKTLIKEVKSIVTDKLVTSVNADLKKLTHLQKAGLGIDISSVVPPTVTDNEFLSLFLNGTFYSEANQATNKISHTDHLNMEIGSVGRQDLMIHVPTSFLGSAVKALAHGGLNVTDLLMQINGHKLTYTSFIEWNSQLKNSVSGDRALEQVNWVLELNEDADVVFDNDALSINNGEMRQYFYDINGVLMADYTIKGISINCDLGTNPLFAQLWGSC